MLDDGSRSRDANIVSIGPGISPANDNGRRILALDVLRVSAVAGVIAIHVFAAIVSNPEVHGSRTWWTATAVDIGFIWVVPVFVMVSGALLLGPAAHRAGPRIFYRKRLARLAPAFFFWQLFYITIVRVVLSSQHVTVAAMAGWFYHGTTYTHLYFLWLIAGLYVVAPVLSAFLGESRARAYWVSGIAIAVTSLTYAVTILETGTGPTISALTQWIPYVGYFVAGWALRKVHLRGPWLIGLAILTLVLLASNVVLYAGISVPRPLAILFPINYLGPLVALTALGVFSSVNSALHGVSLGPRIARLLVLLSDAAFGVFLLHFALIVLADKILPKWAETRNSNAWAALVEFASIAIISFAISLVARRIPYVRRVF